MVDGDRHTNQESQYRMTGTMTPISDSSPEAFFHFHLSPHTHSTMPEAFVPAPPESWPRGSDLSPTCSGGRWTEHVGDSSQALRFTGSPSGNWRSPSRHSWVMRAGSIGLLSPAGIQAAGIHEALSWAFLKATFSIQKCCGHGSPQRLLPPPYSPGSEAHGTSTRLRKSSREAPCT